MKKIYFLKKYDFWHFGQCQTGICGYEMIYCTDLELRVCGRPLMTSPIF